MNSRCAPELNLGEAIGWPHSPRLHFLSGDHCKQQPIEAMSLPTGITRPFLVTYVDAANTRETDRDNIAINVVVSVNRWFAPHETNFLSVDRVSVVPIAEAPKVSAVIFHGLALPKLDALARLVQSKPGTLTVPVQRVSTTRDPAYQNLYTRSVVASPLYIRTCHTRAKHHVTIVLGAFALACVFAALAVKEHGKAYVSVIMWVAAAACASIAVALSLDTELVCVASKNPRFALAHQRHRAAPPSDTRVTVEPHDDLVRACPNPATGALHHMGGLCE
jgi:hypothetical protein